MTTPCMDGLRKELILTAAPYTALFINLLSRMSGSLSTVKQLDVSMDDAACGTTWRVQIRVLSQGQRTYHLLLSY
jgi:hypothetical protein